MVLIKSQIFETPSLKQALCEIRYEPLNSDFSTKMFETLVPILRDEYLLTEVFANSPVGVSIEGKVVPYPMNTYKFYCKINSYRKFVKNVCKRLIDK